MPQVCIICGTHISVTSLDQEHCSQQCYDQNSQSTPIRCIVCRIGITPEYDPIRVCSRECWEDLDRVNSVVSESSDSDTDDSEITREPDPEPE